MSAENTVNTSVDKLLPGISHYDSISTMPVELSTSVDSSGKRNFQLLFAHPFTRGDIQLTILSRLVDQEKPKTEEEASEKRRGVATVTGWERADLWLERKKILEVPTSNVLEKTASDIFTPSQARADFLSGHGGREYKRMYSDTQNEPSDEMVFFMSEVAGIMKKHPELWRRRKTDSQRVSDVTAISRYAQLGNQARGLVHSEFFFRLPEDKQKEAIERHMELIQGAGQMSRNGLLAGFVRGQGMLRERIDGGWSITSRGDAVRILEKDEGFTVEAMTPDVLIAGFAWNSNGIRSFSGADWENKEVPVSSGNPRVDLVYKVSNQNLSKLLSVLVLERIHNIRNRMKGKYIEPAKVMEDSYARRNTILNASELVRNAEGLLLDLKPKFW